MSNKLTLRQFESFLWETAEQAKEAFQSLVQMLDEATRIVDFFDKRDEKKRVVIENFDESLVKPVAERFMELAEVKFK